MTVPTLPNHVEDTIKTVLSRTPLDALAEVAHWFVTASFSKHVTMRMLDHGASGQTCTMCPAGSDSPAVVRVNYRSEQRPLCAYCAADHIDTNTPAVVEAYA